MLFSVITKNLNWEFLTKNLVTCEKWDGVKDKKKLKLLKVHIFRGFTKAWGFLGFLGAWTVCRFIKRIGKKKGWSFWEGVDTLMHTMQSLSHEQSLIKYDSNLHSLNVSILYPLKNVKTGKKLVNMKLHLTRTLWLYDNETY